MRRARKNVTYSHHREITWISEDEPKFVLVTGPRAELEPRRALLP